MQKRIFAAMVVAGTLLSVTLLHAQSKADDIPIADLPAEVKSVLEKYAQVLYDSKSVEEAATGFASLAGGSLVNESGALTSNTKQFGLKKDFYNFKHYAYPVQITRVNKTISNGDGYGATKIAGMPFAGSFLAIQIL